MRQHNSFIVRIWWEDKQIWRGWVQHVGSKGEEAYVQSLADLLAFIQAHTGELGGQPGTPGDMTEAS